ncbi:MAG: alpha-D-ribose 1-methylphosphonate 5-triphosphate diphosphatase [Phyllobacteriaceae bacterium]|nr:alpha-D-ribose 1-methylphosphonate 5-triphosphate diphosphatase [Phyllobacteriaceae bacterium]
MPATRWVAKARGWHAHFGGKVLVQHELLQTDILLEDTDIAEIGTTRSAGAGLDAHGLLVLPGMVDIHGDAFERQIMPRPNVSFDHGIALAETDRQMLVNGITTAYHGITWSWEPGLRGTDSAAAILRSVHQMAPRLAVDTRIHLRHETYNVDAESTLHGWLEEGLLGCLAFNDHTTGTILVRHRPDKFRKMVERSGLPTEDFMVLVDRVATRADEVMPSLRRLAATAQRLGVPLLSHDDMSPQMRTGFRAMGASIAEFPINEETAASAAAHADPIVFGAPNVLRGGSHTGCPSATDMAQKGLCTILASDYYYPALLHAPFKLASTGAMPFGAAWALVASGPAQALGLEDRGAVMEGKRADLLLVEPAGATGPEVVGSITGGKLRYLTEPSRLRH